MDTVPTPDRPAHQPDATRVCTCCGGLAPDDHMPRCPLNTSAYEPTPDDEARV